MGLALKRLVDHQHKTTFADNSDRGTACDQSFRLAVLRALFMAPRKTKILIADNQDCRFLGNVTARRCGLSGGC
jgi:hypothetical protein